MNNTSDKYSNAYVNKSLIRINMYVTVKMFYFQDKTDKSNVLSNLRYKGCHCVVNKVVQGAWVLK